MNGRRTIVGLCMLCALLVSAFAAQSASAVSGTTAYTCVKDAPTIDRVGEHCLDIAGTDEYGHKEIPANTTTEGLTTNQKTASETTSARVLRLKLTLGGVPLELSATGAAASGWMENKVNGSGEHYVHGKGTTTFTGVEVTAPAGRGCQVFTDNEASGTEGEAGVIHTRELTVTSEGQGDFLKFQAADGGNFATFFITCEEGKKIPALEGTWSCNGSVKGVPNGVTTEFTHAATTTQNTLKCKNTKAGIDFATTGSGRANSTQPYTPLSMTTVTT